MVETEPAHVRGLLTNGEEMGLLHGDGCYRHCDRVLIGGRARLFGLTSVHQAAVSRISRGNSFLLEMARYPYSQIPCENQGWGW